MKDASDNVIRLSDPSRTANPAQVGWWCPGCTAYHSPAAMTCPRGAMVMPLGWPVVPLPPFVVDSATDGSLLAPGPLDVG